MATTNALPLRIRGLGKQKTAALVARAQRLGLTPQGCLKHLVEEDLAISERAKKSTFEDLLGSGREVDEAEVDRLVEEGKVAIHRDKLKRS